jgi:predicted molibdopterin-dependent oxidoreductase YjgC
VIQLYAAAEILALHHPMSILCGIGISDPKASRALISLQLLLGNLGLPGGGVNSLRALNNTQGAIDMGCTPHFLTGYQPVSDVNARHKFQQAWGRAIREEPGMKAPSMIADVRALYIVGEDILNTSPEAASVRENLEACEFVVLQEMSRSETTRYADVILPGVSFAEKTGTFTNTERRVQMVNQAIQPIGDSHPDWQIIADLGHRLGSGWIYTDTAQIMDEINALTPIYAGVSHERLQPGERLQWPVGSDTQEGTPILPFVPV